MRRAAGQYGLSLSRQSLSLAIVLTAAICVSPSFAESESAAAPETAESAAGAADDSSPPDSRFLVSGQVLLLEEALKSRGLEVAEEMADQAVLETEEGTIIPLLADWRGRAFFQDERLRNRPVELVATKRPGLPYLQVLMVFTFDEEGHRQYTDYWCDVCSIPMYEIQPCACCQGEIRLRFQDKDLPSYLKSDENGGTD